MGNRNLLFAELPEPEPPLDVWPPDPEPPFLVLVPFDVAADALAPVSVVLPVTVVMVEPPVVSVLFSRDATP